jgi:hypothetical protein
MVVTVVVAEMEPTWIDGRGMPEAHARVNWTWLSAAASVQLARGYMLVCKGVTVTLGIHSLVLKNIFQGLEDRE